MDPRLGVPTMVLSMMAFLDIHVDTPGLFRQRVPPEAVGQTVCYYPILPLSRTRAFNNQPFDISHLFVSSLSIYSVIHPLTLPPSHPLTVPPSIQSLYRSGLFAVVWRERQASPPPSAPSATPLTPCMPSPRRYCSG